MLKKLLQQMIARDRDDGIFVRALFCLVAVMAMLCGNASVAQDVPETAAFVPSVEVSRLDGVVHVTVSVSVARGSYIHEDSFHVSVDGVPGKFIAGDKAVIRGGECVFSSDFTRVYSAVGSFGEFVEVKVSYAGCLESGLCLMPEEKVFRLAPGGTVGGAVGTVSSGGVTLASGVLGGFRAVSMVAGYQSPDVMVQWLEDVLADAVVPSENILLRVFRRYGLWLAAFLVLPLGVLLNLTPCVLPMIPVTLAILGAGSGRGSRLQGFRQGGAYGLGMALCCGVLGCCVVLTGGQFGSLNSHSWFNGGVACVFIALGLSMFDVFCIDFSRFRRGRVGAGGSGMPVAGAFAMGALSAILSGACIAPVLIWVLLLSADLYVQGRSFGLVLPLLLGVGMGLPWPILGAGLSRLPRPGQWMVRLRQGVGVLILLLGVYYGWVCIGQMRVCSAVRDTSTDGWLTELSAGIAAATAENKPILLDFWGVSCKNCTLMDAHVLSRLDVRERLKRFVCVKLRGDDTADKDLLAVMKALEVQGFPTYVVLKKAVHQ